MPKSSRVLVLLLLVALVAACAAPAPGATLRPSPFPVLDSIEASAPDRAPTATVPPLPTPLRGQTADIRVAVGAAPLLQLLPGQAFLRQWAEPLYDDIVGSTEDGALDSLQGFAEAWRITPDGRTWELQLRHDVRFHDGAAATAQDVKFTLEWPAAPDGDLTRTALESVEAPDQYSVLLRFSRAELFFAVSGLSRASLQTGLLLPKHYIEQQGLDASSRNPLGSGPYRFKSAGVGPSVLYEAIERHWYYGAARARTVELRYLPGDVTRVAALKTGALDVARVPRQAVLELKGPRFDVQAKAGNRIGVILLHEQYRPENPLNATAVRKALELAIDRKLIAATLMRGLAQPRRSYPQADSAPGSEGIAIPAQDLKAAKALLTAAGYPNGFELQVVLSPWEGLPEGEEIMAEITAWWERLGLRVEKLLMEPAQYHRTWREQRFDLPTVHGVALLPVDPEARTWAAWTAPQETQRLTDDVELVELAEQVRTAPSISDFVRLSRAYQQLFSERVIFIPLFVTGDLYAVRVGLGGDKWRPGPGESSINIKGLVTGKPA